jgi:hypothetical protein
MRDADTTTQVCNSNHVKMVVINMLENQPAAIDLGRTEISFLTSEVEAVMTEYSPDHPLSFFQLQSKWVSIVRGPGKVSKPAGQALRQPMVIEKVFFSF